LNEFNKGGKYHEIYGRLFNFHKQHQTVRPDEWDAVAEEICDVKDTFEAHMLKAICSWIESECKHR